MNPWERRPKVKVAMSPDKRTVTAAFTSQKEWGNGTKSISMVCKRHLSDPDRMLVLYEVDREPDDDAKAERCWMCTTDEWLDGCRKTLARVWELLQTHHDVPMEARAAVALALVERVSDECVIEGDIVTQATYAKDMAAARRVPPTSKEEIADRLRAIADELD